MTESDSPHRRLPNWLKTEFSGGEERMAMRRLLRNAGLHTVCEGANCPNMCECWKRRTSTFMILGDTCTRACKFCSVNHGKPQIVDPDEPQKIADAVANLRLRHAVITCVTRDDLPDGGSGMMAATVKAIRQKNPDTTVEVLCSDYNGIHSLIDKVIDAAPEVYGHNLETVERLSADIRSKATYRGSLDVLKYIADEVNRRHLNTKVKSGIMLGLGETREEILQTFKDLRDAGVTVITMGQYLQPTASQVPVACFLTPDEFQELGKIAEQEYGFTKAISGPLVRSSYLADTYL